MNILYLLGGPPRTAKSTIMSRLIADKAIPLIATDAVQEGLRNVFVDEPYQMLRSIEFEGWAEYKTSIVAGGEKKPFSKQSNEAELTHQALIGMLDHYARNNISVAIEGAIITPEWVAGLRLEDFTIRAAFVGFTNPAHADTILAFAKSEPSDWVNQWLNKEQGDETKIRTWVAEQAVKCQQLKADAELHGFKYFDISNQPFEDYLNSTQSYFLQS